MDWTQRSAIVTGGAGGLGAATVRALDGIGLQVVVFDRALDAGEQLVGELGRGQAVGGDVNSDDDVNAAIDAASALAPLAVVVNVAGVLSFSHTHQLSLDEWNRLLSVNLTGTFLVCREALPHLLATGGNIVNLASTAAHKGQPWATAYVASKGGVLAFTRSLAVEYAAQGLRVNSISPGAIDTPITQAFHLPEGADIKQPLSWPLGSRECPKVAHF